MPTARRPYHSPETNRLRSEQTADLIAASLGREKRTFFKGLVLGGALCGAAAVAIPAILTHSGPSVAVTRDTTLGAAKRDGKPAQASKPENGPKPSEPAANSAMRSAGSQDELLLGKITSPSSQNEAGPQAITKPSAESANGPASDTKQKSPDAFGATCEKGSMPDKCAGQAESSAPNDRVPPATSQPSLAPAGAATNSPNSGSPRQSSSAKGAEYRHRSAEQRIQFHKPDADATKSEGAPRIQPPRTLSGGDEHPLQAQPRAAETRQVPPPDEGADSDDVTRALADRDSADLKAREPSQRHRTDRGWTERRKSQRGETVGRGGDDTGAAEPAPSQSGYPPFPFGARRSDNISMERPPRHSDRAVMERDSPIVADRPRGSPLFPFLPNW